MDIRKFLKPSASPQRNGFDLSRKHVFEGAVGRLDCPLFLETVPKDYFEIDIATMQRTMTFDSPAFLRGKYHYDFYFVPYSQIFHPFNQFISQRTDKHSVLQKGHNYVPVVHLPDLLDLCFNPDKYFDDNDFTDIHGYDFRYNAIRLLDQCGYGNYFYVFGIPAASRAAALEKLYEHLSGRYVNIFRLAAYQHIFYDIYRNKFFDTEGNGEAVGEGRLFNDYVSYFNWDDIECDTFAHSIIPVVEDNPLTLRLIGLLQCHYVQWKQDLIQSVLPNTQFGAVSSVSLVGDSLRVIGQSSVESGYIDTSTTPSSSAEGSQPQFFYGNMLALKGDDYDIPFTVQHSHPINLATSPQNVALSVLDLRKAELLQRWKQNALRGGNMVDDAFRAHYGVSPRYESDNNVDYIGSFEAALDVNAVQTNATTSAAGNNKTGDLAGTGTVVVRGSKLKYNVSDFGVIVCVSYFTPESEYNSTMLDVANRLSQPFDFFTEEFCNVGLDKITYTDYSVVDDNDIDIPLGFAPAYSYLKTALDKVFGNFAHYPFVDSGAFNGNLSHWVSPRDLELVAYTSEDVPTRSLGSFYVNPNVYDNVLGVNYETSDKQVAQFVINAFFDIKAIRPMSELGLPQF